MMLKKVKVTKAFLVRYIVAYKFSIIKYLSEIKRRFKDREYLEDKCCEKWYSLNAGNIPIYENLMINPGEYWIFEMAIVNLYCSFILIDIKHNIFKIVEYCVYHGNIPLVEIKYNKTEEKEVRDFLSRSNNVN